MVARRGLSHEVWLKYLAGDVTYENYKATVNRLDREAKEKKADAKVEPGWEQLTLPEELVPRPKGH
jgi:hypothetical protein